MIERRIRLQFKDESVRGMNRKQYKSASHYVRSVARLLEAGINWDLFDKRFIDLAVYGRSHIRIEDLI